MAAAVVVALGVACWILLPKKESPGTGGETPGGGQETGITPPAATGDVDDAVTAILNDVSEEGTLTEDEDGDTTLVTDDSTELDNIGQTLGDDELK